MTKLFNYNYPQLRKIFILRNSVYLNYSTKNGDCQSPFAEFVISVCNFNIENLYEIFFLFVFPVFYDLHSRELFTLFFFKRVDDEFDGCFLSRNYNVFQ